MKLGIFGSRKFTDYGLFREVVLDNISPDEVSLIISGGAIGTDSMAERLAKELDITPLIYKPDFSKGYHAKQYFMRNRQIVEESDKLFAFRVRGHSRGTDYTIGYAEKLGKDLTIFKIYIREMFFLDTSDDDAT